jgi:ribose transport system substrate-binding protein
MKSNKFPHILIAIIAMLLILLYNMFFLMNPEDKANEVIYFVSKTNSENNTFWRSVENGAKVAANELGVDLIFVGPERELDLDTQVEFVEEGIRIKPKAIILAASDYNYLTEVAEKVIDNNITFVTVDSDVGIKEPHSFIATNSIEAAKLLGIKAGRLIDGEGKVAIVSHLKGASSAFNREEGFKQGISSFKYITLIDEIEYSNNDVTTAYEKTKSLIKKYPDLKCMFGTNEATLIGMAKAIKELGVKDQITLVGFDISVEAAGYLEEDVIKAIIAQKPFNMGYLSVKEAIELSKNTKEYHEIDVDVVLINKENMFDSQNQRLLIPFLEE